MPVTKNASYFLFTLNEKYISVIPYFFLIFHIFFQRSVFRRHNLSRRFSPSWDQALRRPQVGVIYLHEEKLAPMVHDTLVASSFQYKYNTLYKHSTISPMLKICPPTDLDSDFRQVSVLPQLGNVIRKL